MRTRRVMLGLSTSELCERVGVSAESIADFEERGDDTDPTRETAVKIADVLELSLGDLTGDDTARLRRQWFIERALYIAVETDGVSTISSAGDEHRTTLFLPRKPSDTVRQRLRALGDEYAMEVDVRMDQHPPAV